MKFSKHGRERIAAAIEFLDADRFPWGAVYLADDGLYHAATWESLIELGALVEEGSADALAILNRWCTESIATGATKAEAATEAVESLAASVG